MKYLIKHKDGSVAVMTTIDDATDPVNELAKLTPENKEKVESHRLMDESEMPTDRYFRDAWVHQDDKIHVDLDKSLAIHQNVLRELRKPRLEELDGEYMRALENADETAQKEAIAKKVALRDITAHPDLLMAKTPEEIKNFRPAVLFG
jgi:hypothetical protein